MRHFETLPPAVAIAVAVLVAGGATLTLLASLGLVRLQSFYQRLHAPSLAYSYGAFLIVLASMLMFSVLEGRAVIHEILIGIFLLITTPITLLMLGRAALRRDRDRKLLHDEIVPARLLPEERARIAAEKAASEGKAEPAEISHHDGKVIAETEAAASPQSGDGVKP